MKTIIDTWTLSDMADLAEIIEAARLAMRGQPDAGEDQVVYVGTDNEDPTQFTSAALVRTVLTDGSVVFDLRLS